MIVNIKILVAEDDPKFRGLICDIIRKEGYIPIEASDGEEAVDIFFKSKDIDILILDIMMPKYDGFEVLKEIREYSELPVIMLTALGDERHEVNGLESGADEYISKPFSYPIFIARLNSIVRKLRKEKSDEIILRKININQKNHKVIVDNMEVELNNKEYNLLNYLVKNKDRVLTRQQILDNVWGYDFDGDIRTIDTHIKTLRAKLSVCGDYIKTVRGSGYMFDEENDEDD